MTNKCLSLVIHGGAGAMAGRDYAAELAHMRGLTEAGRDLLRVGRSAMDVAVATVAALEASGLYVAGRGASANSAGKFELDASLMDGPTRRAGAVAALQGFASPIRAARAVMEATPHVLLAGEGAAAFAAAQGLERVGPEVVHAGAFGGNAVGVDWHGRLCRPRRDRRPGRRHFDRRHQRQARRPRRRQPDRRRRGLG